MLSIESNFFGLKPGTRVVFKSGILPQNEALNEIGRFAGYSVFDVPGNVDPWVAESLKAGDRERYEEIRGLTKRGSGVTGMYKSLFKYAGDIGKWRHLPFHCRRAMALSYVVAKLRFKTSIKREPLDWDQVGPLLKRDTSAGITWIGKKKGEVLDEIYPAARWLGHRLKHNGSGSFDPRRVHFPPCLAAKRGHLSPIDDPKTRLVWLYPSEMLVIEGLYAPALYSDYSSQNGGPMLLGGSPQQIFRSYVTQAPKGLTAYGFDFKAFDTKPPPWLIRMAFNILHDNVEWDTWRGKPCTKRDKQKWRNVWDGMVWYFINTPILMPDGRMFRKHQGVPSGSWFTQLIDSIVNYIIITYCGVLQSVKLHNLRVLGDDSVFWAKDFDIARAIDDCKLVNMDLSEDKTEVAEFDNIHDFKLLGTKYVGGKSYRTTKEWFELTLYSESWVKNAQQSFSRMIGLWLSGACHDSEWCKFFRYYQSGYELKPFGEFSMDQRRMMSVYTGQDPGKFWNLSKLNWERHFMYTL